MYKVNIHVQHKTYSYQMLLIFDHFILQRGFSERNLKVACRMQCTGFEGRIVNVLHITAPICMHMRKEINRLAMVIWYFILSAPKPPCSCSV